MVDPISMFIWAHHFLRKGHYSFLFFIRGPAFKRENTVFNIEYFMESVCVQYLRTSWSSIGNRTSERSERVRILIQKKRVRKYCTHTLSGDLYSCLMTNCVTQIEVKSS